MYRSPAKPGWYEVDGQTVFLDSESEAIFMRCLVKNGFSDKWRRPKGVARGQNKYTPDFELSVLWDGQSVRAHVEYKSTSATQFKMDRRNAAIAALNYYGSNPLLLLYIGRTKRWYCIDNKTKRAVKCAPPIPSNELISIYATAAGGIPITNKYGRKYKSDTNAYVGSKVANALEFCMRLLLGGPKKEYRKRNK